MDKQVRAAKAIVDVDEIHFLKHVCGEPTITQNLIDGYEADGVTPLNPGWFSAATIKDTVTVSQDPLSLTKINIDQSNMPIGVSTEAGDFNVEFDMPSMVLDNLKNWLENNSEDPSYTPLKIGKASGYGYDFNADLNEMVLAVSTKTGEWYIFPFVQGSVAMQYTDKTWRLHFSGMVLGATNENNNDVYILSEKDDCKPASSASSSGSGSTGTGTGS